MYYIYIYYNTNSFPLLFHEFQIKQRLSSYTALTQITSIDGRWKTNPDVKIKIIMIIINNNNNNNNNNHYDNDIITIIK